MRGPNKHDAFQKRLDQIEEERRGMAGPKASSKPVAPRTRISGIAGRTKGGLIVIAALCLSVLGSGAYAFKQFTGGLDVSLSEYAMDKMLNVVAREPTVSDYDGLLTSGPKERKLGDTGWELPPAYVLAAGRSDLTFEAIAVSAASSTDADGKAPKPAVSTFALNDQCTLRRPKADEVVHNVTLADTSRYTHIHSFSKQELAEAVVDRVAGITAHKRHYKNAATAQGRMGQVDVYVTDTSAPVYLVLQVFDKDVLWNIHLAEGAQLGHVAMIGNRTGFAAPDGGYSYEALRIRDFVAEEDLYENEERRPCMLAPWRKAQADWPLMGKQDDQHSAHIYRDQLRRLQQGYAAYAEWYGGEVGVTPDTNLVTANRAATVLVGPLPDAPVTQEALAGRQLYLADNDYVAFGTAELDALHVDLLVAAAGGDLATLKPGVQKAVSP